MTIGNFRGDLTDISAIKEAMPVSGLIVVEDDDVFCMGCSILRESTRSGVVQKVHSVVPLHKSLTIRDREIILADILVKSI